MRSLNIAATGMLAQERNVEVISNNIANVNTSGYKRQRAEFQDLLYQDARRVGSPSSDAGTIVPTGVQMGLGVRLSSVARILGQGAINITNKPLDLAVNGHGYFQITLPDGEIGYSRDGSFELSPDGEIVTPDGFVLEPGIAVPIESEGVTINPNGEVYATIGGNPGAQLLGQVELANFVNAGGLKAIGNNLFTETAASGPPVGGAPGAAGYGSLRQGALEISNVDMVGEISNLIRAQRAYEMNSKIIEASDEMLRTVNQLR